MKRRRFLKNSLLAGAAFTIVPRHVLGKGYQPPSDTLTKAVIGVGGMGQWHAFNAPGKLLAVCDVDANHLNRTLAKADPSVQGYHNYRQLLQRDDIDIIHIATPPHWHALISAHAAKAGKAVWCEKPMTRTIGEGQRLVKIIQQHGTIFRVNTWFRFTGNFYRFGTPVLPIKKIVENRLLGWPLRVVINESTGFSWKFYWQGRVDLQAEWIPEELDYDFWLGPAPYKPYHHHRVHTTFRGYWDYDGGGLGDMGQHYLDPVQYLLEKDDTSPVFVEADAPQQHPDAVGTWREIRLKYADCCEIILDGQNRYKDAPFIEGPSGKLYPGLKSDIPNLQKILRELPEPTPQVTDFHQAVRKQQKFVLNEMNGHRSATLVNLAKIAVHLGRPLHFDPQKQRFINDPTANAMVDQPMREPWGWE
ncbi:MAG: Gfo/Idh/MocA family oxidoreductase [Caldisericaceae bacterium]|nr:Gfo/Idh/MocA family oxidoreductase [Caldisericaceae bacterium]